MKYHYTAGRPIEVGIDGFNECKYTKNAVQPDWTATYIVESWDIVDGEDAEIIEAHTDGSCIDEYHEYLVLNLTDGDTATFRNSHVDMFRTHREYTARA